MNLYANMYDMIMITNELMLVYVKDKLSKECDANDVLSFPNRPA
jgi:hypothetical protein